MSATGLHPMLRRDGRHLRGTRVVIGEQRRGTSRRRAVLGRHRHMHTARTLRRHNLKRRRRDLLFDRRAVRAEMHRSGAGEVVTVDRHRRTTIGGTSLRHQMSHRRPLGLLLISSNRRLRQRRRERRRRTQRQTRPDQTPNQGPPIDPAMQIATSKFFLGHQCPLGASRDG
jgi:hypothetical protein